MVIIALLIGLAVGAFAVFVAVRPALVERRRRVQEVIALERDLAEETYLICAGNPLSDRCVCADQSDG